MNMMKKTKNLYMHQSMRERERGEINETDDIFSLSFYFLTMTYASHFFSFSFLFNWFPKHFFLYNHHRSSFNHHLSMNDEYDYLNSVPFLLSFRLTTNFSTKK